MAISLIGSTKASGSSTTPTVTAPTLASGDRLYVVLAYNVESTTIADNNGATPCTEKGEYTPSGLTAKFAVYSRDLGGSEPGSYTWTLSSSQRWSVVAWVLRGMHATNHFEVSPAAGNFEISTTPTCPGATTSADNAWVFACAQIDSTNDGAFTAGPSGYTEIQTETGQQPLSVYYKVKTPAGATGNQDFTKTSAGGDNNGTLAIWSVAPAGSGSAPSIWAGIYYAGTNAPFYGGSKAAELADLVSKGVTRFQAFENDSSLITAVGVAGGKVWVELASSVFSGTSGYNATNLATIVNATKNNATVEGYFSNDEADLKGYSASVLQTVYTDFKALTTKPLALNLRYPYRDGLGGSHAGYSHQNPNGRQYVVATGPVTFDYLMIDPYNIPNGNAQSVVNEVAAALAMPDLGGRPVYPVIQSFGWGTAFDPPYGRPPTQQEMTDMGVGSVAAGCGNLFIYTMRGNNESPPNEPMSNFNSACYDALGTITTAWGVGSAPDPPPPDPTIAVDACVVILRRRRRR